MQTTKRLIGLTPKGGWLSSDTCRLSPLTDEELDLPQRSALYLMLKIGTARCPNLFRTLLRNTRLYLPYARFNSLLMPKGKLKRRYTELAILRTAWLTRSYYEWAQHIDIGLRAGLSVDDIVRVTEGPVSGGWSNKETLIITAADELVEDRILSQTTWDGLITNLGEKKLIELMFTITAYSGLASVIGSLGIQLEPDVEQVLAKH